MKNNTIDRAPLLFGVGLGLLISVGFRALVSLIGYASVVRTTVGNDALELRFEFWLMVFYIAGALFAGLLGLWERRVQNYLQAQEPQSAFQPPSETQVLSRFSTGGVPPAAWCLGRPLPHNQCCAGTMAPNLPSENSRRVGTSALQFLKQLGHRARNLFSAIADIHKR